MCKPGFVRDGHYPPPRAGPISARAQKFFRCQDRQPPKLESCLSELSARPLQLNSHSIEDSYQSPPELKHRLHRLCQRPAPFIFPALLLYLQDVFSKKVPSLMASELSPRPYLALIDPNVEGRPANIQQAARFLSADDVFWSHDGYSN